LAKLLNDARILLNRIQKRYWPCVELMTLVNALPETINIGLQSFMMSLSSVVLFTPLETFTVFQDAIQRLKRYDVDRSDSMSITGILL